MNRFRFAVVFLLACCLVACVEGCKKKEQKPVATVSNTPEPAQPKAEIIVQGLPPEEQVDIREFLRVDGVLITGKEHVVNINNQILNVGDYLTLRVKEKTYNLRVVSVSNDRVLLEAVVK